MSAPVIQSASDCCNTCPDIPITQVNGPKGDPGANGTNGTNGSNAFTSTTALFVQPAVNANVNVNVGDTSWMAVGQFIFVQTGGSYSVNAINSAVQVSLKNLGYVGNLGVGLNVPNASKVSPSGHIGTAGASGSTPTLNDISPTTSKGDLIVDTGANNPLPADVRLGAGTNGQILTALSTQPTGLEWQTLLPNAATDNLLPRYDASGTTTPTPLQSSAMRLTDNGALQETGGNAKGTDAVDLQPSRTAVTQVASGNNATIGGGRNNTSSGADSTVAGGHDNSATAGSSAIAGGHNNATSQANAFIGAGASNLASGVNAAVAGGNANTASGADAVVAGGAANTASGTDSAVLGGNTNSATAQLSVVSGGSINTASELFSTVPGGAQATADKYGQVAHASGAFLVSGDAQASELIWRVQTSDATANVEAFLDGIGASKRASIAVGKSWAFQILAVGRSSAGADAAWKAEGLIHNNGGTTSMVGGAIVPVVISDGTGGVWGLAGNLQVTADNVNDALKIAVTGALATDIRWVIVARLTEVSYP